MEKKGWFGLKSIQHGYKMIENMHTTVYSKA